MPKKRSVLFVCVHNSARSQMAEAFLNRLSGDRFTVCSAGLEAGELHPLAVEAMNELGIDMAGHTTTEVFDLLRQGTQFDVVITVCDDAAGERCPVFPGAAERFHWAFDDPSRLSGSHAEQMEKIREIRERVNWFVEERKFI
ncbi:MAG: arsenate reductase ArsC [Candidatus Electrothrix sp. YB6]